MQFSHISPQAGQWIVQSCEQADPLTVSAQVPVGYERYARILHSGLDEDENLVSWSQVAQSRNHILTAADLFETVAGVDAQGNPIAEDAWVDSDLPLENLPAQQWSALAEHLRGAVSEDQFIAGLWAGYAFIEGGERIQIEVEPDPALTDEQNAQIHARALAEAQKPALSAEDLAQGVLEFSGGYRNYHLFEVDGEFLANPLWAVSAAGEQRQLPSLVFAPDRSWLLSTEPYDDCTLIGGSDGLISAILADQRIEAIEVGEFTRIGHSN